MRGRQPCGQRLGRTEAYRRVALRAGAAQAVDVERLRWALGPVRARCGHVQRRRLVAATEGNRGIGRGEQGSRAHGHPIDLRTLGGGDELSARAAQRPFALQRPVLLADESRHPQDHEPEQHDRRRAHDRVVTVAGLEVMDDADDRSDQRRAGQEDESEARQGDLAAGRRLVEPRHRRVQAGGAPEQV